MNRAQRRSQGVYAKQPTLNFTDQTLKNAVAREMVATIEKERLQVTKITVDLMIAIITIAMHDSYGFGKKRLNNLLLKIQSQFECVDSGTVNANELMNLAQKILGREV